MVNGGGDELVQHMLNLLTQWVVDVIIYVS
jgi:hypothetical protein